MARMTQTETDRAIYQSRLTLYDDMISRTRRLRRLLFAHDAIKGLVQHMDYLGLDSCLGWSRSQWSNLLDYGERIAVSRTLSVTSSLKQWHGVIGYDKPQATYDPLPCEVEDPKLRFAMTKGDNSRQLVCGIQHIPVGHGTPVASGAAIPMSMRDNSPRRESAHTTGLKLHYTARDGKPSGFCELWGCTSHKNVGDRDLVAQAYATQGTEAAWRVLDRIWTDQLASRRKKPLSLQTLASCRLLLQGQLVKVWRAGEGPMVGVLAGEYYDLDLRPEIELLPPSGPDELAIGRPQSLPADEVLELLPWCLLPRAVR